MTWIRLEHTFPDHPKIDALSDGAFRLHVTAMCWAGDLLTDGFIPTDRVPRLVRRYKASFLRELTTVQPGCSSSPWDEVEGGYQIHDFLEYQQSSQKVKTERAANAERQRRWKENKKGNAPGNAPGNAAANGTVTPLVTGDRSRSRSRSDVSKSRSSHQGVAANGHRNGGKPDGEDPTPETFGHPEATGPDETTDDQDRRRTLAIRWQGILADRGAHTTLADCNAAVAQALHTADWHVVDQQIGWLGEATTAPRTPTALVTACRRMVR